MISIGSKVTINYLTFHLCLNLLFTHFFLQTRSLLQTFSLLQQLKLKEHESNSECSVESTTVKKATTQKKHFEVHMKNPYNILKFICLNP